MIKYQYVKLRMVNSIVFGYLRRLSRRINGRFIFSSFGHLCDMDVRRAYDSGIPKMPDTISYKMTQDSQIFTFCKFHTYFENRYQYVTFWMCEICARSNSIILELICIQRSHFHGLTYEWLDV